MGPEQGFCAEHTRQVEKTGEFTAKFDLLIDAMDALRKTIADAFERINTHISEGEGAGGSRERIKLSEVEIRLLKDDLTKEGIKRAIGDKAIIKNIWRSALVAGIIGGLIGKVSPDAVAAIASILKHFVGI